MSRAHRLVIDRIACTGHGLCAELFPEHLALDEWGYPIQSPGPIPAALTRHARRAVAACPALALRLDRQANQQSNQQSNQQPYPSDVTSPPSPVRKH